MKILITGATGLIGQKLIKKFIDNQHTINILTRDSKSAQTKFINQNITMYEWNQKQPLPEQAFDKIDVIINLMGENIGGKLWSPAQKAKLYNSRIDSTKQLVDMVNKLNLNNITFINASAIGYYNTNLDLSLTEDSAKGEGFLPNLCSDWENCLNELPLTCKKVIFRTGVVLSKDGGALQKMLLPFKLGLGGIIGNGQQKMSWIHIEDMVNLYYEAAIEQTFQGIYNATAPNPVSNYEFTKALGRALNRPTIFPVPKLILKLIFGEMSTIILDSQEVVPKRLQNLNYKFKYPTISLALNNIFKS